MNRYIIGAIALVVIVNNSFSQVIEDSLLEKAKTILYEDVSNPNYDKALKYLNRSAQNGNPEAMTILGIELTEGYYFKLDKKQGYIWLKKAVKMDNEAAIIYLAMQEFSRHPDIAVELLMKGDSINSSVAQLELANIYLFGVPFSIDEIKNENFIDEQKGIFYLKKSAEGGNTMARYQLGVKYLIGINGILGVDKNRAKELLISCYQDPEFTMIDVVEDLLIRYYGEEWMN